MIVQGRLFGSHIYIAVASVATVRFGYKLISVIKMK